MAKKTDKAKSLYESSEAGKNFESVFEHYNRSWDDLVSQNIQAFTEKEAMLIGTNLDSITGQETSASVFDPRLATISLERCGRVMAQNPTGKCLAMSADDRGKNLLMNLIQDKWVLPNANSQYSFLIKSRLWDLYSLVYGVMFSLVDRVDTDSYFGPDFWLLPIRHVRPQPGRFSIKDSDWFGVSSWVTPEWLAQRNKDTWKNVDKLLLKLKETGDRPPGDKDSNERSHIELSRQPNPSKSKDFKQIEIYTEYRKDRWVTVCPEFEDAKLVLRDIENPHGDDTIPVVAKYAFPLIDSIYGLGEFERGKTLQYALNSLWNLYLDGVKMSIFPPIQMVAEDVVPSSILMEPAAKWLLTKPNAKIETFNTSPQGINTFQNTYQFLLGAILNMAGTTDTTVQQSSDISQGKTPAAIKLNAMRESTRDAWDRFMMEEALQDLMGKFVNLTVSGMDKAVELRLFASEIEQIAKAYPDVVEMVEGAERGKVKVTKEAFENTKFDYQITKGSTYKADSQEESENLTQIVGMTIQNYQLLAPALQEKGKKIDLGELYQRVLVTSGIQDWDKIIVDIPAEQLQAQQMQMQQQQDMMSQQMQAQQQMAQGQQMGNDLLSQIKQSMGNQPPMAMQAQNLQQVQPQQSQPQQPQQGQPNQFSDPDIANFAKQVFG